MISGKVLVFDRGSASTCSHFPLLASTVGLISKEGTKFHNYEDKTECWDSGKER